MPQEQASIPRLAGEPRPPDSQSIRSAAAALRNRNPFRIERSPTAVRFGSPPVVVPPPIPDPTPPRPQPVLAGIVGGPPWLAVIEGIPGREAGVLLAEGEEVGGVRLERLRGDTAVLSSQDTTWVLVPKRLW